MNYIIHRKERIIFTAIDVISELGVQSLSTKLIASKENISESTVFKHFQNKNILMLAVLDYYAQYDLDIFESIQLKRLSAVEGLRYYIEAYTAYYENYPAITAITQGLNEMRYNEELIDRVDEILNARTNCLLELVKACCRENALNHAVEPELVVDIILGTVNGIILRWRSEQFKFVLKDRCLKALEQIFRGLVV